MAMIFDTSIEIMYSYLLSGEVHLPGGRDSTLPELKKVRII
mgnify:CR=1 FL=1